MKTTLTRLLRPLPVLAALCLVLVGTLGLTSATPSSMLAKNRYLGAESCESCHSAEGAGDQYHAWKEMKHAGAFELLKSERSLEVAKEQGITGDPWKADACLKCHVTGHGEDPKQFKKSFKVEEGVSCESCHGPSEQHKKVRFRAAAEEEDEEEGFGDEEEELAEYVEIPAGEMVQHPDKALCLECHNPESPTYKHFCYYQRADMTRHLDPRRPRTEAELDALLVCKFGDDCACTPETCDEVCPIPPSKLKE